MARVYIYIRAFQTLTIYPITWVPVPSKASMVVDAAQEPMLALLDQLNPPYHRTSYSHFYIDLSRSVATLADYVT